MSTLKYIVIDHQGIEFPIVFPMLLEHKVVAKGQDKVVAAGFCIYSGGKWFCSGKSLGSVWSLTSGILVEHYIAAPPFMYAVTTFVWLGACIGAALYLIP